MPKWLNERLGLTPTIKRELFPTEELAAQALRTALDTQQSQGRTVTESVAGDALSHEIHDDAGFVATYWLSDNYEA